MHKKGAELSLTVIIVAILALLVLVVLSVIFMGRSGAIQKDISSCETKGGTCAPACGNPDYGTEGKKFVLPSSVAYCQKVDGEPYRCCSDTLIG